MLIEAPILLALDWNKTFHVHIDASKFAIGCLLAQPGKHMSPMLIFTILKEFLQPFLINWVQGERTRTREIDKELGNYLD